MGYAKAFDILPAEMVWQIQQYIDGGVLYIPRKEACRKAWGAGTCTKRELAQRNARIYSDFKTGVPIVQLAQTYHLAEKSIQRILRQERQKR